MSEDFTVPENYSAARQAFLAAADACCAQVESLRNRDAEVDATPLFMDVAILGRESVGNVLVVSSGVHGVEGFIGSAVQTALLNSGIFTNLPDATGVVLIHAVNPFGFAHLRRVNEHNVDLNRNFVDFTGPLPGNPDYDRLADVIAPVNMSVAGKIISTLRLFWCRLRYGRSGLQKAVTQGQYSHPEGLFYGGDAPSWSRIALEQVIGETFPGASRVTWIDLHTGLGPYGHGELILYEPDHSDTMTRARQFWGNAGVRSAASGDSVSADLNGTLNRFLKHVLSGAEVTAAGLEFGTFPAMDVFRVMQAENRMHQHGHDNSATKQKAKNALLNVFCPDDELWRQRVWQQSQKVIRQALAALIGRP